MGALGHRPKDIQKWCRGEAPDAPLQALWRCQGGMVTAPSHINPAQAKPLAWYLEPEAAALVKSLRANPPKLVSRVQEFVTTVDRWTEFAPDSRITKLRAIWNDAFLDAEREGGEAGAVAFLAQPDVDDILASIGGHEKLCLGVKVPPRAPLSSFADIEPGARHVLQSVVGMSA